MSIHFPHIKNSGCFFFLEPIFGQAAVKNNDWIFWLYVFLPEISFSPPNRQLDDVSSFTESLVFFHFIFYLPPLFCVGGNEKSTLQQRWTLLNTNTIISVHLGKRKLSVKPIGQTQKKTTCSNSFFNLGEVLRNKNCKKEVFGNFPK